MTTNIDHASSEALDVEAARRKMTRAALAREVLEKAFPPPPRPEDTADGFFDEDDA